MSEWMKLTRRGGALSSQSYPEKDMYIMTAPWKGDLKVVAAGTKAVTAGLLLTRPDVGDEGKLLTSSKIKADPKKCPQLPLTKIRVLDEDTSKQ